jgi:MFS transporter, DHA2 family, multidrug resistance protein
VASAVNDTTRELGGALGIAVLGTIVSSLYRSRLDLAGLSLPAATTREAEASVGQAVTSSRQLSSGGAGALVQRAGDAFTDAFALTAIISATIVVVAAILVVRTFSSDKELAAEAASVLSDEDRPALADLAAEGAAAN